MKITQLLEGSVAGDPGITQNSQQAPRFGRNPTTLEQVANVPNVGYKSGRDPKVLEKKVEETTAGCVASVAQPLFKQSRTTKESSISTGIKSSKKYSNSPVTEDELSEEQLLAKQLRHELFKKSKLRDIGKPIKKSDILLKKELEQGVAEGHADQQRKIFKKNGKPVGEVGIDRESSPGVGQWYMTCYGVVSYGGYDSYEEAVEELKHCLKQKQGLAEAIPYALSAANANAEYERTKTFVPRGYKGRVDLDVGGHDEYTEVMHTLQHAAKQAGQHVECGRSGNEMSVFSKTMGTDELDAFIDDTLEQGVAEGTNDTIYPGAEVIKSKNGKPLGEIYQDKSGWGCFHYKADNGADCIDSREEALFWLKELNDEYRQDRSLREQGVAEGDVAKLAGITALGIGAGLGANYLDQQSPKVEFDGKNGQVVKAYLEPAYSNRIPDNAMTIKGKDGKTYHVWSTAGKGMNSKSYHAAPVEQVKEGLVDTVKQGAKKAWDYATEPVDAPNMDTYKKHRAKNIADIRKKKAKQQGVAEGSEERSQNRLWQMITDYEKRAKATSNDIKKAHYLKMADELRSKLKTSDLEEGHRDEENPFEKGSMGDALYKALGSKKASPQQVQRNRERFAKRDAERYTIANDPEKPGLYHYSDISHALQNGHGDSAKVYKHNKFIGTVGDVRQQGVAEESKGLWANIHAKRERIKHGSGEHMRKPGSKGAPTADALRKSAK